MKYRKEGLPQLEGQLFYSKEEVTKTRRKYNSLAAERMAMYKESGYKIYRSNKTFVDAILQGKVPEYWLPKLREPEIPRTFTPYKEERQWSKATAKEYLETGKKINSKGISHILSKFPFANTYTVEMEDGTETFYNGEWLQRIIRDKENYGPKGRKQGIIKRLMGQELKTKTVRKILGLDRKKGKVCVLGFDDKERKISIQRMHKILREFGYKD